MTMMNPIFMSINVAGLFATWKTEMIKVIQPGALLVSYVGIAVLAVVLAFQIIKAVTARNQNPGEFQTHVMWCIAVLVGIALLSTYAIWSAGFFGG